MNRNDFMMQLEKLLSDIPQNEREEALKYYNDYFNDAGAENEQEVISSLGTPEQVAEKIKEGLPNAKPNVEFNKQEPKDDAPNTQNNLNNAAQPEYKIPVMPPKKKLPAWAIILIVVGSLFVAGILFSIVGVMHFATKTIDAKKHQNISKAYTDDGSDTGGSSLSGSTLSYQYDASKIQKLDVQFGAGAFAVREKETDDGNIDVIISGYGDVTCKNDDNEGTLYLKAFENIKLINLNGGNDNVTEILIPRDYKFNEADFELGACAASLTGINATEMECDIGAGELIMNNMVIDGLDLDVGAGKYSAYNMQVKDLDIDVGMGEADLAVPSPGN